ncbi:MAG: hypothetical protein H6563_07495 [Lewinellaceae bacterium]|nr:hypothetical protein [Lewinellaceae bacterium]
MFARKLTLLLSLCFISLVFSQCVDKTQGADEPQNTTAPIPNLEGIWVNTYGRIIYWNKTISTIPEDYETAQFEIKGQNGAVFEAYQSLIPKSSEHPGRHGSDALPKTALPLLGVIDWDGMSVWMTDIGDNTIYKCTITGENTMQCMVWESGDHALAGRILLERK